MNNNTQITIQPESNTLENTPIITTPQQMTPDSPSSNQLYSLQNKIVYDDDITCILLPPPTPPTPQNLISTATPSQKTIRIFIVGYYYHNNIGDDQYMDVFKYILQPTADTKYKLKFVHYEKLTETVFKNTDIVIIGGGDVLNDPFLDIINNVFKQKENIIIAVSVGMPDRMVLVNTNKMNIIDYLFVRTKQEYDILKEFYPPENITYLPDLSYFMTNISVLNETLPKLERSSFGNRHVIPTDPSTSFLFNDLRNVLKSFKKSHKHKIIGVCLNKWIFSKETADNYQLIVKEFALFVEMLLYKGCIICFLPFNTYTRPCENQYSLDATYDTQYNDILIHNDVYQQVNMTCSTDLCKNIINIQHRLYPKETFEISGYFDFAVTMGQHSTLFSIYKHIPFLPIFTSKEKEIRNLLLDIDYPSFLKYELEINPQFAHSFDSNPTPLKIDNKILRNKMVYLLENKNAFEKLKKVCQQIETDLATSIPLLLETIANKNSNNNTSELIHTSCQKKNIYKKEDALKEMVSFAKLKLKLNNYCGGTDFRRIEYPEKQKIITSIVSFYLTGGDFHSVFCEELNERMFFSNNGGFEYNYINEWSIIIKENLIRGGRLPTLLTGQSIQSLPPPIQPISQTLTPTKIIDEKSLFTPPVKNPDKFKKIKDLYLPNPNDRDILQFNIHYFNQENKNGERSSGWNYLFNELVKYHTTDSTAPLLDMYIERTFKWEKEVLKAVGIIPYLKKWRGFIHHSFDSPFSKCNDLLQIPEFVKSLPSCECIYVFSKTLELQLRFELSKIGWDRLSVISLIQPAETECIVPFRYSTFLKNNEKRILHLGGQSTNTFIFYHLQLPPSIKVVSNKPLDRCLEKTGLKHKTRGSLIKTVLLNVNDEKSMNVVKESILNSNRYNNLNREFYHFFDNLVDSVENSSNLKNEEYNELLSKNIVFIHLEDVSTINTIIDCCIHNCPFFVNRHPAVVELVGDKYPLFYDIDPTKTDATNFFEVNKQVECAFKNASIIYKTYKYLSSLDKTKFHIGTFINSIKLT